MRSIWTKTFTARLKVALNFSSWLGCAKYVDIIYNAFLYYVHDSISAKRCSVRVVLMLMADWNTYALNKKNMDFNGILIPANFKSEPFLALKLHIIVSVLRSKIKSMLSFNFYSTSNTLFSQKSFQKKAYFKWGINKVWIRFHTITQFYCIQRVQ